MKIAHMLSEVISQFMSIKYLRLLLAMTAIVLAAGAEEYTFQSGRLDATFASNGRQILLTSLSAPGSENFLAVPTGDLWQLTFRCLPTGSNITVTPDNAREVSLTADTASLFLRWHHVQVGESSASIDSITARISRSESGWLLWNLSFENCPDDYALWETTSFRTGSLRVDQERDFTVVTPSFWGRLYRDFGPGGRNLTVTYPSNQAAMQFVAVYDKSAVGLLVSAWDEAARQKAFLLNSTDQGMSIATYQTPYPMGVWQKDWRQAYPIALTAFTGDWFDAGRAYAEWASQQSWLQRGRLYERTDLNRKFAESPLNYSFDFPAQQDAILATMDKLNQPALVQLYVWHEGEQDHNFGNYTMRPGVPGYVAEMHRRGHVVMPYFNGILFDTTIASYRDLNAEAGAVEYYPGKIYQMIYNNRLSAIMCPWTPLWQRMLTMYIDQSIREFDSDGIYLDQIGSTCSICFQAGHPHEPGGDWSNGFVNALAQCDLNARAQKSDFFMITEDCSEPYMRYLDGYLMRQNEDFVAGLDTVPLFQSVYSGYAVLKAHGPFRHVPGSEGLTVTRPWLMDNSRMLLWGAQIGCINCGVFNLPDQTEALAWLRNLIAARLAATEYLVYGTMLKPPTITTQLPYIKYMPDARDTAGGMLDPIWNLAATGRPETNNCLPGVMSAAYAAPDNRSLIILLTSIFDTPKSVDWEFALPAEWPESSDIEVIYPKNSTFAGEISFGKISGSATIPARNSWILRVDQ